MPASIRRPRSRSGRRSQAACAMATDVGAGEGAAGQAAAEPGAFVMKGTSGERKRAEPPGALSRARPAQTRPGRSLALVTRPGGASGSQTEAARSLRARRCRYRSCRRQKAKSSGLDGWAGGQKLRIGGRPDRPLDGRNRPVAPDPIGPGTVGMRRNAVEGATVGLRQKRPFLKEASNASAQSEAQHSTGAIECRETT